jgi:choline-sulfatase
LHVKTSRRLLRQASSIRLSPSRTLAVVCLGLLGAGTAICAPEAPRPNIVVVVIDALRPDHLGCYGYERATSPAIDGLAAEGIVFDSAITHAPWTKATFATMLTSLYPFQHGVESWESVMSDTLVTLAEVLEGHGYETICVANVLGVAGRFNVLQGFAHASTVEQYKRTATKSNSDAFEIIRGTDKPFFLLIHYYDAHLPYFPPEGYIEMVGGRVGKVPRRFGRGPNDEVGKPDDEVVADQMLLYDACIRYTDDAVREIVDFLDEQDLTDETALIVTADHGEAFWEHDVCSHGEQLYDEALKVPLILSYPAVFGDAKRIDTPVGHIDLMPTVLDLAGAADRGTVRGQVSLGSSPMVIIPGVEPHFRRVHCSVSAP